MPDPAHETQIEASFTRQADAFEDSARNQVFTGDARWVFDRLPRHLDDLLLDVAAGTGLAARQLAPGVRAAVAIDATPAMLERGRRATEEEGIRNLLFMRGDARALPFSSSSFDVCVCRFALHHLEEPADTISEITRCTRSEGRVALVDLLADDDPAKARVQNRLEQLRDPSHVRLLSEQQLHGMVEASGLRPIDFTRRTFERPLTPWLEQTAVSGPVREEIIGLLEAELDGGEPTGFAPRRKDGELWFEQTYGASVARA
jgi:ubiquinone/menaquinone biosynthesis C-methylase UbiE